MTVDNAELPIIRHIKEADDSYDVRRVSVETDYHARFVSLDKYLNQYVHPRVTAGAAANDDNVWLTDHGPSHISRVLKRIGDLTIVNGRCVLSPYEAYLIAVAAHFHDVGNVFGRDQHEKMASSIMFGLDESLIGDDNVEKRLIGQVAKAHGGFANNHGDRDTIGNLPTDPSWLRSLAAILRFADELADDKTRTHEVDEMVLAGNNELRGYSEIYHVYARHLKNVQIDHVTHSAKLLFEVLDDTLLKQFGKDGSTAFLLDEIFDRTLKMHREQIYCDRFMRPAVLSERVDVKIVICRDQFNQVVGTIPYVLEQRGYPNEPSTVAALAPEITGLTGEFVSRRIKQLEVADEPREPNVIEDIKLATEE